jgi:ATP-dependent RNA helicase DDX51/DBP6
MARGMDIENVKYVISYDPPPFIKTYIHRVGRTARAGKVGTAITMLQKKEVRI